MSIPKRVRVALLYHGYVGALSLLLDAECIRILGCLQCGSCCLE